MSTYYYALVDENDILCVDQLDSGDREFSEEEVTTLADQYPGVIYFVIEAGV